MNNYFKVGDSAITRPGVMTILNFTAPELPAGCSGMYLIDASRGRDALLANIANDALPLVQIASPVAIGPGMVLSQVNGFDTGIAETAAMTVALVTKRTTAKSLMLHTGTVAGIPTDGLGMFCDGTAPNLSVRFGAKNGANAFVNANSGNTVADPEDWLCAIGAVDASNLLCGVWYEGGHTEGASAGFTGRTVKAGTLRLGGIQNSTGGYTANFSALFLAVWPSFLSAPNRAAAAAGLRSWAAEGGIPTL